MQGIVLLCRWSRVQKDSWPVFVGFSVTTSQQQRRQAVVRSIPVPRMRMKSSRSFHLSDIINWNWEPYLSTTHWRHHRPLPSSSYSTTSSSTSAIIIIIMIGVVGGYCWSPICFRPKHLSTLCRAVVRGLAVQSKRKTFWSFECTNCILVPVRPLAPPPLPYQSCLIFRTGALRFMS